MGSKLKSLSLFLLISSWALAGVSGDNILDAASGGAAAAAKDLASAANGAAATTDAAAKDASGVAAEGAKDVQEAAATGANAANTGASLPCIHKLLPCQPFLKHPVDPPQICCDPLTTMVGNDAKCLCEIFNNDVILKQFNITKEEALKLPTACGANPDLSKCPGGAPATPGTPATPGSAKDSTSTNSAAGGESPKGWLTTKSFLFNFLIFNLSVFLLF